MSACHPPQDLEGLEFLFEADFQSEKSILLIKALQPGSPAVRSSQDRTRGID